MRPQFHVMRLRKRRHLRDIAVEHLEVEHQGRRVERAARPLLSDEVPVQALGFTGSFAGHFF
jgi:hypothetical protein